MTAVAELHRLSARSRLRKMGKKYYCDYCDKAFADNPVNRKNHLNGVMHKQMRDMHYQSFAGGSLICSSKNYSQT